MTRFFASTLLLASICLPGALINPAHAQEGDMFPTKSGALQRAKHLKCTGVFQMGDQWMPCKDYNAYEKALKNEKN
jgi:Protein of unknown function